MNEKEQRELESLVSSLCDGVIEPDQQEQLEQMLRGSAECRRIYLQVVDMHARLTMHPNLVTGIPIDHAECTEEDDQVVLELARSSMEQFATNAERARKRRRYLLFGKWISLALAILVTYFGWHSYDQWRVRQCQPKVASVKGECTVDRANGSSPPSVGDYLLPGQTLRTGNDVSQVTLAYADGTKVVVGFSSTIELPTDRSYATLQLLAGTIDVDAAPQRPDRPLVFRTAHARYVVVGTRFRLYREEEATRLEMDEGKVRVEQQGEEGAVEVTAGQVAVAAARSTPIEIIPLATGRSRLIRSLRKAGDAVTFSADGAAFATSDWQRGLRLWNLNDDAPFYQFDAKVERTSGLAFGDDGAALVQVNNRGKDGMATIWRHSKKKKAKRIRLPGKNVRSRALSPHGLFLAESSESGLQIFAVNTAKARLSSVAKFSHKGKAWCMSLSESGKLAAAGYWNGPVRVYDVESKEVIFERKLTHTPTYIALSQDGNRLAIYTHKDGLVLIDLLTGQQQSLWAGGVANVSCLRFTSDGQRVLAGLNDGTARMWSIDGRALLVIDVGHTPRDVAWSDMSSIFATANGSVNLWQCEIP